MIRGLGIDVVEVDRIAHAMRNPRFVSRILTERERMNRLTPAFVAGRWAAKEAVAKAVSEKLRWQDVEIISDAVGKPIVHLIPIVDFDADLVVAPVLLQKADEVSEQIHLSISHERGIAAAVAVWEEP